MKRNFIFRNMLLCMLFFSLSYLSYGQVGLEVNQGSFNSSTHNTGYAWIGNPTSTYLSLDNNEIQARNGTAGSILYLNYFGGDVDLLGISNTTGNFRVDGNGLFYVNATNRLGVGTNNPQEQLDLVGGDMRINTNGNVSRGIRLFQSAKNVYANLEVETSGNVGEVIYNMSVNWGNGGGTVNSSYDGAISRIDTRAGGAEGKGFNWLWIPAGASAQELMSLQADGNLALKRSVNDEMVIINDDLWEHSTGEQDFGDGGDHFIMASKEGSSESAGVYGDGDHLTFWSPGDGAPGQPTAIAYFLDEDSYNGGTDNIPHDDGALKVYLNNSGTWVASDRNRKNSIQPIGNALDKVMQLDGFSYNYSNNDDENAKGAEEQQAVGFIAQELNTVIPQAVQMNDAGEHFVNYDMVIPVLLEAVKEQQAIIDAQQAQIQSILDRID